MCSSICQNGAFMTYNIIIRLSRNVSYIGNSDCAAAGNACPFRRFCTVNVEYSAVKQRVKPF